MVEAATEPVEDWEIRRDLADALPGKQGLFELELPDLLEGFEGTPGRRFRLWVDNLESVAAASPSQSWLSKGIVGEKDSGSVLEPQTLQPLQLSTDPDDGPKTLKQVPTQIQLENPRAGVFDSATAILKHDVPRNPHAIQDDDPQVFNLRQLSPDLVESHLLSNFFSEEDDVNLRVARGRSHVGSIANGRRGILLEQRSDETLWLVGAAGRPDEGGGRARS